ncbi:MAG: type II 3-dehydroquinate dehydratase [Burkholderiales bacterium]|nr:type II 3-dehydroquinate dehydratase [Burkholderiales bacterium]
MAKFLVVHGAGINMRGKSQIEVFGTLTMADYDDHIRRYARELNCEVEIFHSNIEGEVINRFYEAFERKFDGALINPAGYTTDHAALCAAITQVGFPVVEVHLSNPAARGRISDVGRVCRSVVTGFGITGYRLALEGLMAILREKK